MEENGSLYLFILWTLWGIRGWNDKFWTDNKKDVYLVNAFKSFNNDEKSVLFAVIT